MLLFKKEPTPFEMNPKEFSLRLLQALAEATETNDFVQATVAKDITISEGALSKYIAGKGLPSYDELRKIIKYCNDRIASFNTDYLLGLSDSLFIESKTIESILGINEESIYTIKEIYYSGLQNQLNDFLLSSELPNLLKTIDNLTEYIETREKNGILYYASDTFFLHNMDYINQIWEQPHYSYAKFYWETPLRKHCEEVTFNLRKRLIRNYYMDTWQNEIDTIEKQMKGKSLETNARWVELTHNVEYLVLSYLLNGNLTKEQEKIKEKLLHDLPLGTRFNNPWGQL